MEPLGKAEQRVVGALVKVSVCRVGMWIGGVWVVLNPHRAERDAIYSIYATPQKLRLCRNSSS